MDPRLLRILRCPRCRGRLRPAGASVGCRLGHVYSVRARIPLLRRSADSTSRLDEIDYDAVHGIGPRAIAHVGTEWAQLFEEIGQRPGDVLELGAGTGVLSKGLLAHAAPRSLVITDVSETFLVPLCGELGGGTPPVHAVVFDANRNVFARGSFDTVVGRSILHHLLDYARVLKTLRRLVRRNGVVVVFEPVLHGKTILALLAGMILKAHEKGWQTTLDEADRERLARLIRHITKAKWLPQDRESLARLDDKYIFDVDALLALGRSVGFRSAEFRQVGEVDPSYWPYLRHTLAVAGIGAGRLQELKWVCDVFGETYGLAFSDRLTRPMGFFVFRR